MRSKSWREEQNGNIGKATESLSKSEIFMENLPFLSPSKNFLSCICGKNEEHANSFSHKAFLITLDHKGVLNL